MFFVATAKRIDQDINTWPQDIQYGLLRSISALKNHNPNDNGCARIEGVKEGYRLTLDNLDFDILYTVDEQQRHIFVFGVYHLK